MKKIIFSLVGLALVFGLATTAMADTKTVVSDASVNVYGPLDHYAAIDSTDWGVSKSAVITWKHPSWPTIIDATWISSAFNTENPRPDSWRLFSDVIDLPLSAINITGSISVTSDNAEEVYLNGILIGSDGEVQGTAVDNQEWNTIESYPLTGLHAGTNELDIIIRNYAYNTDSPTVNPAGLIYKAEITYEIGDIIAPIITFDEPITGLTHSGTIHLKATCNETCNYVNFWWRAEGEGYGDFRYHHVHTDGTVFEWDLNTLSALKADSSTYTMADGVYYLYAAGKDLAGNWARTPGEIKVTVDNNAPDVTITNPGDDSIVSGVVDVRGSVTDANPHHYWLVIQNSLGVKVAGPGTVNKTESFTDIHLLNWDTTLIPDGDYTIKLEARDAANNKDSGSVDWHDITVKNVPDPIGPPIDKNECKKDGWKIFDNPSFKNQGDCVSYVQSIENAKRNKNK